MITYAIENRNTGSLRIEQTDVFLQSFFITDISGMNHERYWL